MANGGRLKWLMANGYWLLSNGKRQMANGSWLTANAPCPMARGAEGGKGPTAFRSLRAGEGCRRSQREALPLRILLRYAKRFAAGGGKALETQRGSRALFALHARLEKN